MRSESPDKIMTFYKNPEGLKDTAISQGKTSIGRIVSEKISAIRTSIQTARKELDSSHRTQFHHPRAVKRTSGSPMEVVSAKKPKRTETDEGQWMRSEQKKSDSSRRTLSNHSRAVKRTSGSPMEVVSAKKPKRTETDEGQWIETFKNKVDRAIHELNEEKNCIQDDLSFFLKILRTLRTLRVLLKDGHEKLIFIDYQQCKEYMMHEVSPLYKTAMGPALKILQNQIDTEGSWSCFPDLRTITRYLDDIGPQDQDGLDPDYGVRLKELWRQSVQMEFSYLKYLKNVPNNRYSAKLASKNIYWMLRDKQSPIPRFKFMSTKEIKEAHDKAEMMYYDAIDYNIKNSDTGREKENPSASREVSQYNTRLADLMGKRVNYDKIRIQLEKLQEQFKNPYDKEEGRQSIIGRCIDFLEKLKKLHDEHNKIIGNHRSLLRNKLEEEILRIVERINTEIRRLTDDDDQQKEKAQKLINHLREGGYMDEQLRNHHAVDIPLKNVVGYHDSVDFNKMTVHQYHLFINAIFSDIATNISFTDIVRKLKELDQNKVKINRKDPSGKIQRRVNKAWSYLYTRDIDPVFKAYDNAKNAKKSHEEVADEMHKYKDTFILVIGNEVIFHEDKRPHWILMACLAWSNDIDELCKKSSFNEHDINDLLLLKDVVPDPLQNEHIKNHFQTALTNMLLFMSENNPSVELTKRVMQLSKWVKDLDEQHDIDPKLYKANKKWQERQKKLASATSSGTSVGAHSGTAGVSLKASDRYPYMEQQNASHMKQPLPSIFSGVSASATTHQPLQQPASIAHYMPTTLSPAGIRPQPSSSGMPMPEIAQPLQQPASIAHYMPTTLSPAGIRPQPSSSGMPVPEIAQPLQQPASIAHYMPTTLSPAGIRPQPSSSGMPVPEIAQPLQQPASIAHYMPTTLSPAGIRPQPSSSGMLVPEIAQPLQQPASIAHYMPTTLSPAGIRPQPSSSGMLVPEIAQPLQQPASIAHYTPMAQSPNEIRPQLPPPNMSVQEIVQTLQQLASIAQSLAEIPSQPATLSAHHEASTAE